jgi:hypothetical protein
MGFIPQQIAVGREKVRHFRCNSNMKMRRYRGNRAHKDLDFYEFFYNYIIAWRLTRVDFRVVLNCSGRVRISTGFSSRASAFPFPRLKVAPPSLTIPTSDFSPSSVLLDDHVLLKFG